VAQEENLKLPQLSLAERDRRYNKVRAAMAQANIDVLLAPANTGRWEQLQADSRYLTSIGGFATEVFTVFPLKGEVSAYIFNRAAWWKKVQSWVSDVRDGRNRWGDNAIGRLKELGFSNGTIGITGLAGLFRAPDGIIPSRTVQRIQENFPAAKIVNATEMMQQIRSIKSAEEIAMLERCTAITEKTIETMKQSAMPGITERALYGTMLATMLSNGGELPTLFLFGTGPGISGSSFVPSERVIKSGDRIVNEIEAKYAGYAAQAVAPMVVGKSEAKFSDMVDISAACFNAVLAKMKSGVTFGELFDTYTNAVESEGKGNYQWSHPMMHARGLGDESPALLGDSDLERFRKLPLQEGMAFILKPQVRNEEAKERASIGDTVVVTANGARRLGQRPLKLITKD
jgi:Xaa-Pro aminopeptidase